MEENFDEITLRRYLLGELSGDEQIAVEDRVFADTGLYSRLETAENDLIDEYVRGELDTAEGGQFEKMFFNSEERRQKIEFARAFQQLPMLADAKESGTVATPAAENFWQKLLGFFQMPQIAFAAVLLLIFGFGAWFLFNRSAGNPQIARQENVNQKFDPEPEKTPANVAPNTNPVNETVNPAPNTNQPDTNKNNDTRNSAAPTPTATPVKKSAESAPTLATLVFPSSLLRDGGGNRKFTLSVPANAARARLIFTLEKGDERPSYQIEVANKSGTVITGAKVSSPRQIALTLPTTNLPAGFYTATLRGINADGTSESLGYYDFEVIRR